MHGVLFLLKTVHELLLNAVRSCFPVYVEFGYAHEKSISDIEHLLVLKRCFYQNTIGVGIKVISYI